MLPELTGIGRDAGGAGELGVAGEALAPAISPISLAAVSGAEAGLGEQLRRDLGDELGDLGLERVDGARELAHAAQLVAGDPDARGLLGARRRRAIRVVHFLREQRAARQRQLGPEVVQVPEQVVVERDAHADEPFAVIDQQPDVELDAGQLGDRQRSRPSRSAARATASASIRSDLPRSRPLARAGHQPRRDATTRSPCTIKNRSKEPETCRQSSSAQTRSPPSRAPRPAAARTRARRPRRSARRAARRSPRRPPRSCASACACPHRARSWPRPLSPREKADARRTRLAGGGATLLSSHAGTSPTGDERHAGLTAPIQTASVKQEDHLKGLVNQQAQQRLTWFILRADLATDS